MIWAKCYRHFKHALKMVHLNGMVNVFNSNFNTASSSITETNIRDFAVDPSIEPSEEFFLYRGRCFTLFVDVIDTSKASGPAILPKCLKVLLNPSIPLSHIFLIFLSIMKGYLKNGSCHLLFPYRSLPIRKRTPQIIDLYHYSRLSVNFWKNTSSIWYLSI